MGARGHRTRVGWIVAIALAGLAIGAPAAGAARIDSDPLTVEIDARGATSAYTAGGQTVFDGGGPELRARLNGGDVIAWPTSTGGGSGPVVRDGDEQSQVTRYRLGPFAVEQTTSVRDGDIGYVIRWRLRNTGAAPLAFRLGAVGHLKGVADYTPLYERAPSRFLGTRDLATGEVRGFAEVPGDPWAAWRHGYAPETLGWFDNDPADGGSAYVTHDHATVVTWNDMLAPGASVEHALRVEVQHGPRIAIAGRTRAILGRTLALRATARDALGEPLPGARLRVLDWGASRTGSAELTTGPDGGAGLDVTGERAGTGYAAVWLDQDGDGRLGATEPRAVADTRWVPRLAVSGPGRAWTGTVRGVSAVLYDEEAASDDAVLRWRIEGPHAAEHSGRTYEGGGTLAIAGEREGTDRVSVHADLDGDGERDEAEPSAETTVSWQQPEPGIGLLADTLTPTLRSTLKLSVSIRDAANQPVQHARLRWWSEGASADDLAFTAIGGSAPFGWHGDEPGASTITIAYDADDDGRFEADEPRDALSVTWQAPPRHEPPADAQVSPRFGEAAPQTDGSGADEDASADPVPVMPGTGPDVSGPVPSGTGPFASGPVVRASAPPARARATPPRARLGRVAPAGRSRLRVSVRCPRRAATTCRGAVTVRDRAGRRRLGRARFRIAPGTARTVRVALRANPRWVRVSVGAGRGVLRRAAR